MAEPLDELDVLLTEARREPADDTPRLVLADWLQDRGDPRGELIAIQLRRERTPEEDPEYPNLLAAERALLHQHALRWLDEMADPLTGWTFTRGFLSIEARAQRLLPLGDRLSKLACYRFVEALRLREVRRHHAQTLAFSPLLATLVSLDLSANRLDDDTMLKILTSPRLRLLRKLDLSRNHLGSMVASWISLCPNLVGLRELDLSRNRIGGEGALALAESRHLQELTCLDVRGNPIDAAGITALQERFGDRLRLGRRGRQT